MKKLKISGKELRALGYPEGPVISTAMRVMEKNFRFHNKEEVLHLLKKILTAPGKYSDDEILSPIAKMLLSKNKKEKSSIALNTTGIDFSIFGAGHIEEGALHQMYTAAKLPVAVAGSLMPDAHQGYGLPIGGVLATENAVIPYGVGVDIGCRMCLSIYEMNPDELVNRKTYFTHELNEASLFGSGAQFETPADHEVMEHELFNQIPLLKTLQGRAWKQLGSSGSGNHFVEFGTVTITEKDPVLNIEAGTYVGLLSHSGSRGLGANIANHYTKIAKTVRQLPGDAASLAWLSLDEEAGMEYWLAMNLAGDYASACHHIIHNKIAKQLGQKPLTMVENHHNFAWKEMVDGRELVVHRKGATPAGKDVLGIIPGSMTAAGYIVKGRGNHSSLSSASHGAGRLMSRTKAMQQITDAALQEELNKHNVTLIGGGLDEAPFAYKDIGLVMNAQQDLVDVVGKFIPKIVKMDGAGHKTWHKKKDMGLVDGE